MTTLAELHVSGQDDSSSLLQAASRQTKRFPGTEPIAVEEVEVTTLDAALGGVLLSPPVLLKLDVQAFELEALRNGESLLSRVHTVLCECSLAPFYEEQRLFEDILLLLHGAGLSLVSDAHSSVTGRRGIGRLSCSPSRHPR